MDCSLPGSVHEILQAVILEWVAIFFSRESFQSRDWTPVSHTAGRWKLRNYQRPRVFKWSNEASQPVSGKVSIRTQFSESMFLDPCTVQFSLSVLSSSVTPWTSAHQASLSITSSWSVLKLMSIEWVIPYSHLILCHPLLLPWIFPSISVFSNESALHIR